MSGVVVTDAQRRDCLRQVLNLDPGNQAARTGLARLSAQETRPPATDEGDIQPFQTAPTTPQEYLYPSAPTQSATSVGEESGRDDRAPSMEKTGLLITASSDKMLKAQEHAYAGTMPAIRDKGPPPEETQRRKGYRNIMIAGAMTFTMLCSLVLLILTVTTVVPQARERMKPTPEPVLYTATLWCPPCEQAGNAVILWEKAGDGISRGFKVGELPHKTEVSVLIETWSAPEERTYFKVVAQGQKGWVPETFIRE
jgi:hypothetical protein